ncbi:hypothetical protein [Microbispora sp. H10830]|uniref:hypothetical protein n=1 Tax=Microbispora sp. H10830 TaxID=2729109 RepID=UPI0016047029|nr:hypothetical protein [Microbispora sp. H10830]
MILILSDRRDTTVRRVLPKIERLGVPVTWWDSGEFPARSRVSAAFADNRLVHTAQLAQRPGEHVFLEIDPNGAWAPVEESTGLPVSDAIAAWPAA